MKAEAEVYKGIEFVRISSLSVEQRSVLGTPAYYNKVIKILRDTELISDCLTYTFYKEWYLMTYPESETKELSTYTLQKSA